MKKLRHIPFIRTLKIRARVEHFTMMGLGQYDSLAEYCGPHIASSVFLLLLSHNDIGVRGHYEYCQ